MAAGRLSADRRIFTLFDTPASFRPARVGATRTGTPPSKPDSVRNAGAAGRGLPLLRAAQRGGADAHDADVAERRADAAVERERDGEIAVRIGERARAAE